MIIFGLKHINYMLKNNLIVDDIINKIGTPITINYYNSNSIKKVNYIFNTTCSNYRFNFNNKTNIYNENIYLEYNNNPYNYIVKFNYLQENELTNINEVKNIIIRNSNNIITEDIILNIISWQFGMFQEDYPKNLNSTTKGFWSKRECNFLTQYNGTANSYTDSNGDIKYNYGSLQDGTGVFIKLIIDYYLKNINTNTANICLESINLFIDFLNEMINDNGGIPQYFPLQGYHFDNICINDGAFINYLKCCDFILNSKIKNDISSDKILLLTENYTKALTCLLNLQIEIEGKKTIWTQQYDPLTLEPTSARSFEQISLCSLESSQILLYLMSKKNPSNLIKSSIISGCEWFYNNKISDYTQRQTNNNIYIINDKDNVKRNLYSRYYTIDKDSEPIFFDRDENTYSLSTFNDMPLERRNGYTWLGTWGDYLLKSFEKWKIINLINTKL